MLPIAKRAGILLLVFAAACTRDGGESAVPPDIAPPDIAPPDAIVGRDTSWPPGFDTARATGGGAIDPGKRPPSAPVIPGGGGTRAGGGGTGTGGGVQPPGTGTPPPSPPVSVRGTVAVTGSHPMATPVLRPAGGGNDLAISGADSAAFAGLSGLEVEVRGVRNDQRRTITVSSFLVLSSAGEPVLDGTLEHRGQEMVLRTAGGDVTIRNPPHALHDLVGSRIWLGGSPETGPNTYGVIRRGDG